MAEFERFRKAKKAFENGGDKPAEIAFVGGSSMWRGREPNTSPITLHVHGNINITPQEWKRQMAQIIEHGQTLGHLSDEPEEPGFYWVKIALDPDTDEEWANDYQPARWTGERWAILDSPEWAVTWVGPKIEDYKP